MKKAIILAAASILSLNSIAQNGKSINTEYGKNILRFNPINIFAYGGVGFGLGYERILTDDGKFGVKIPFHIGLQSENYYNGWGNYSGDKTNVALMINPGVKFYPVGQRKVTYGLGFSLFGITGTDDGYNYDNGVQRLYTGTHSHFGMMVDNSIQFNLTPKFNIGLELGLGPSYYNRYKSDMGSYTETLQMMGSFNFHMGFRF